MQFNGIDANSGQKESSISSIAANLDGTTNTMMVGERTGGGQIYLKGHKEAPGGMPWDIYRLTNGGGWGDFLNGEHWYSGSLYDGTPGVDGGPCAINCSNVRSQGFYGFHPGGIQALLADGSVRFVSETADKFAFAAFTTRKKSEVAPLP